MTTHNTLQRRVLDTFTGTPTQRMRQADQAAQSLALVLAAIDAGDLDTTPGHVAYLHGALDALRATAH